MRGNDTESFGKNGHFWPKINVFLSHVNVLEKICFGPFLVKNTLHVHCAPKYGLNLMYDGLVEAYGHIV